MTDHEQRRYDWLIAKGPVHLPSQGMMMAPQDHVLVVGPLAKSPMAHLVSTVDPPTMQGYRLVSMAICGTKDTEGGDIVDAFPAGMVCKVCARRAKRAEVSVLADQVNEILAAALGPRVEGKGR